MDQSSRACKAGLVKEASVPWTRVAELIAGEAKEAPKGKGWEEKARSGPRENGEKESR